MTIAHTFRASNFFKAFFALAFFLLWGTLAFLPHPSYAAATNNGIGVVDVFRAYKGTDLGKAIQRHLDQYQKKQSDDLRNEQNRLNAEGEKLRKESKTLSKDALNAKEAEFQKKVRRYRIHVIKARRAVAKVNTIEIKTFLKALSLATVAVGKKNGYHIILAQHPIHLQNGPYPLPFQSVRLLYFDAQTDLTNTVVQFINANIHPKKEKVKL